MPVFAVVTRVPEAGSRGNLAVALDVYIDAQAFAGGKYDEPPLPLGAVVNQPLISLFTLHPVFILGEIVILDEPGGREVCGIGRKPSKWDIDTEEFADVAEAIARVTEIRGGGWVSVGRERTHSICVRCWNARDDIRGSRPAVAITDYKAPGPTRLCCYCAVLHASGLFVRGEPHDWPHEIAVDIRETTT